MPTPLITMAPDVRPSGRGGRPLLRGLIASLALCVLIAFAFSVAIQRVGAGPTNPAAHRAQPESSAIAPSK